MHGIALALAAGMMIGSGPEQVSAEITIPLEQSGEWAGTGWGANVTLEHKFSVNLSNGRLSGIRDDGLRCAECKVVDQGEGHLHFVSLDGVKLPGIYKQDGDRLTMCIGRLTRPTTFQSGGGKACYVLYRVQPRK